MSAQTIDIFEELSEMQTRMDRDGMQETVQHYSLLCQRHSDQWEPIATTEINKDYLDRLFEAYCEAFKLAEGSDAAAIYFEYDMDNQWDANFFVCESYAPPEEEDDDWACDYVEAIPAPGIGSFATIYQELDGFCTDDSSTTATLFMIARTAEALSAVVDRKPAEQRAICIGFHDQDPIHRLRNGG